MPYNAKLKPPTPTRIVSTPNFRSFDTRAQIQAFTAALMDRQAYVDGIANEMDVPEPRKGIPTMRPVKGLPTLGAAWLDLGGWWAAFGGHSD